MTEGEKMVWAATYTANLDFTPPPHMARDNEARIEWEKGIVAGAIESAGGAVEYLREAGPMVVAGFGEKSDVYAMWKEIAA